MKDHSKIWNQIYWVSIGWLVVIVVMMMYDTYLMWFEGSGLEFLQPNHALKTALLTFPMLGLYFAAWLLRNKNRDKANNISIVIYLIGLSIFGLTYYKLRDILTIEHGWLFVGAAILYLFALWPISSFISNKWFSRNET